MKRSHSSLLIFLVFLALITAAYWAGSGSVPFHPDESTFLFMSSDFETFFTRPADLIWRPDGADTLRKHYWLMDAPLGRYMVGFGRWLSGQPALTTDWDWSKTWLENQQAGALPTAEQLAGGRLSGVLLFPLSLLFLFLAARRVSGDVCAWVTALLLAFNGLMWLHSRRAMSESVLVFAVCLITWSLVTVKNRTWLTAIPLALGMAAKHSLGALAPAALLGVLWPANEAFFWPQTAPEAGQRARTAALLAGLFVLVFVILNPFLWGSPLEALNAAYHKRETFVQEQRQYTTGSLDTPLRKTLGLLGGVYLTPPMFYEVGNYRAETKASEVAYQSNPIHTLYPGLIPGGVMFMFSLVGLFMGVRQIIAPTGSHRRELALLLAATLLQTAGLFWLVPLPWQRYYMPLVPLACFWTAYGLNAIIQGFPRPRSIPKEPRSL